MASWAKDFLLEFIELFRGEECLWKITSKDYHNKTKRDESYKRLVEKVKEIDPDANKAVVTRKINSLRSAFRKEFKKVDKLVSGMGADEVYQPKLWYYDQLLFLSDQETPMVAKSSLAASSGNEDSEIDDVGDSTNTPSPNLRTSLLDSQNNSLEPPSTRPSSSTSNVSRGSCPGQFKRQKKVEDKILSTVGERLADIKREDRFDTFGRNVAAKLRALPNEQRIYAEKKINDALFEAEVGALQQFSAFNMNNAFIPPAQHNYQQQHQLQQQQQLQHQMQQQQQQQLQLQHQMQQQQQPLPASSPRVTGTSGAQNLSEYYSNYDSNTQQN